MRTVLLPVFGLFFFSSCTKYQCASISPVDDMQRNEKNEFVLENDTVRIIYSFTDNGGAPLIYIFNKTTTGLHIDWSKSFSIVGEHPISFYSSTIRITGELKKPDYSDNSLQLNATMPVAAALQFIPPQTSITRLGEKLTNGRFFNSREYSFEKEKIRSVGLSKNIRRTKFGRADTPLEFRIYLTFSAEDKSRERPLIIDKSFFVSGLIQTRADIDDLFPKQRNRNMIRMQKSTMTGGILTGVGVIGLLALLAGSAAG